MKDDRTLTVLEMSVALLTSTNPNYCLRTVADVSAELLGSADGIDQTFAPRRTPDALGRKTQQ